MADLITLPGSIPGLLRRGSPVVCVDGTTGLVWDVGYTSPPEKRPSFPVFLGSGGCIQMDERWISLDLTDATGRAHAAWWLAANVPRRDYGRQPGQRGLRGWSPRWEGVKLGASWDWRISMEEAGEYMIFTPRPHGWIEVPGLADLNPDDPRLLPDGSRWVDAEALRLVCMHVAGVSDA